MLWPWALLLLIVLLLGWSLNLIGLPGNWVNVAAVALYAWLMPDHRLDIGWVVVIVVLGLAILGEIIEFIAGAAGVAQTGGTRRGAVLALVGSVMGGILGIFVGLPIPLIGSMLAALLFGGLGALAGAMIGETWAGRNLEDSLRVGHGAFWGRLLGTLGKILLGSVMIAVVTAAIVFRF